jgi:hypothetical protein
MPELGIADAGRAIKQALLDHDDGPAKKEALAAFQDLLTAVLVDNPRALEQLLDRSLDGVSAQTVQKTGTINVIERLVGLVGDRKYTSSVVMILLRILRPAWICGAWDALGHAPPFEQVRKGLFAGLDSGVIDMSGLCAVLIGMYGPDAESVLDELLGRLRKNRTDCSLALPLTWAVYQIGGIQPKVRDVLIDVARNDDSCPHAQPVAQRILAVNQINY